MNTYKITAFDGYGREPVIRKMPDGSFICTFLSGGKGEPANDNVVYLSKSTDGCRTWSEPRVVMSHKARGVWCTEICTEGARVFMIVHTYYAASVYRELLTYKSYSDDNGDTWSEPHSLCGPVNGCSFRQGIRLKSGRLLFPLYWQEERGGFEFDAGDSQWKFSCGVAFSDDDGETWQRRGNIYMDDSLWEPNAIEVEPGHIVMYCRYNGAPYLVRSESVDNGESWSEPTLTDIPNPNTKVTLFKIDDTIFMVNNYVAEIGWEKRYNLCIYQSKDGKQFDYVLNVTPPEVHSFYPHACVDAAARKVYITYENSKLHHVAEIGFDELL